MRCPLLNELPPAPESKGGWPWSQESPQLPDVMSDGRPWPKISIVTPSYNQGGFIEETLRSVLLQGYPNLEYIVIDGGSTDESVEIIRKYEKWLAYWASEPDKGQSQAINKGFNKSSGEIVSWLCSDDVYLPDILSIVGREFSKSERIDIVCGDCYEADENGNVYKTNISRYTRRQDLIKWWTWKTVIYQPPTFYRKPIIDDFRGLDEGLYYAMDYDLWLRLSARCRFHHIGKVLAKARVHYAAKTHPDNFEKFFLPSVKVSKRYWGSKCSLSYWDYWFSFRAAQLKFGAKKHYKTALAYRLKNQRCRALVHALASIFLFPPHIVYRNHLSLAIRLSVGENLFELLRRIFKKEGANNDH
jgi:glycosyltransferase involved in cell wall biosynthesis